MKNDFILRMYMMSSLAFNKIFMYISHIIITHNIHNLISHANMT